MDRKLFLSDSLIESIRIGRWFFDSPEERSRDSSETDISGTHYEIAFYNSRTHSGGPRRSEM